MIFMKDNKYYIYIGNEYVAQAEELDVAITIASALFDKYYAEHQLRITIERQTAESGDCAG